MLPFFEHSLPALAQRMGRLPALVATQVKEPARLRG